MVNPFDDERLRGGQTALVKTKSDEQGRFGFELWVQYTRLGLNQIQVGDLVAVENYTPPENGQPTYSILALTEILPTHFAAQGGDAYPGHVFEAARSIVDDWQRQSDKALHPTTTIVAKAVSTGLQFRYDSRATELPLVSEERNLPMVGAEIRPLSREMVDSIINRGLAAQRDSPFTHQKFIDLNIKLDVESLLTTHFGIFGFTGVGKSNLVSSMVDALTETAADDGANVVIFDPSDEYLALLIDHFVSNPNRMLYIHVGTDSLPGPVTVALGSDRPPPAAVVQQLRSQLKLPPTLMTRPGAEGIVAQGLSNAVNRTRIALPERNLADLIRDYVWEGFDPRGGSAAREGIRDAIDRWTEGKEDTPITIDALNAAADEADDFGSPIRGAINAVTPQAGSSRATALSAIDRAVRSLHRQATRMEGIPDGAIMPVADLVDLLNEEGTGRITIVTGAHDADLKLFGKVLGEELYEARRLAGRRTPFTTFIFDEADLFLPLDENDETTAAIREVCVMIARRGRKFGLGIGLSTQRVTHLDTQVMANLHTYFVSKLPRQTDRARVAEAFGIGEDQLAPTFTFRPGNWLILSHDATGLKGVPIPTLARDATDRIVHLGE